MKQSLLPKALIDYWEKNPHLRLGQIVVNAWRVTPAYKNNPEPEISDMFYISDTALLEGIEKLEEMSNESLRKRDSQD